MTNQPLLRAQNLRKTFGTGETAVTALDGVSFQVAAGELVAIMGASGSGKSTLLTALGGLDSFDSGDVHLLGNPVSISNSSELSQLRRHAIGFVFQDLNLVSSLTLRENIALPLELDGQNPRAIAQAVAVAVAEVGLDLHADRYPDQVSGGQRQRAAIARSFIGERKVLLADEPTGALDSRSAEEIIRLIRAKVDGGVAGVVVTHDAKIAGWADRILVMQDGQIIDELQAGKN